MNPRQPILFFDSVLQRLDRWSERVSYEFFRFGLLVLIPALVCLVCLDVTLRYVFNAPLQWARDVNGLLLLLSIFCALPHAWDRSYHIRMEVFYSHFSRKRKRLADVISAVAGVIFFALMTVQAARFVPFMIQTGETGEDLECPLWPFMGLLSVCAALVVARVLSNPSAEDEGLRYPRVSKRGDPIEGEALGFGVDGGGKLPDRDAGAGP